MVATEKVSQRTLRQNINSYAIYCVKKFTLHLPQSFRQSVAVGQILN